MTTNGNIREGGEDESARVESGDVVQILADLFGSNRGGCSAVHMGIDGFQRDRQAPERRPAQRAGGATFSHMANATV